MVWFCVMVFCVCHSVYICFVLGSVIIRWVSGGSLYCVFVGGRWRLFFIGIGLVKGVFQGLVKVMWCRGVVGVGVVWMVGA